jgi:HlyD family secretion protein
LELQRRRLTQVQAGAKANEQSAQRTELERLDASYRLAESQFTRAQALFDSKNLSAADLESRRSNMETSKLAAEEARYRLSALSEVREPDVRVAESELQVSEAQLKEIDRQLQALSVYAPTGGRVVKVHAHAGEQVGPEGIVELADLTRMAVEAEVYAADIARVSAGMRAVVEMEGGGGKKLPGVVTQIGAEVRQAEVLPNDPVVYSDAHVVPVKISIPECRDSPCPIHARVKVVIEAAP